MVTDGTVGMAGEPLRETVVVTSRDRALPFPQSSRSGIVAESPRLRMTRNPLRIAWLSVCILGAVALPARAGAELRIKWDCFLPYTGIDCVVLESSLTSKVPFVRAVRDAQDAEVVVTLTSVPAENATRFKFDFVGRPVEGYTSEVHTTDKIPYSVDGNAAMVRIMTKLERGLDDFLDQEVAGEVTDGKLNIQVIDPVAFAACCEVGVEALSTNLAQEIRPTGLNDACRAEASPASSARFPTDALLGTRGGRSRSGARRDVAANRFDGLTFDQAAFGLFELEAHFPRAHLFGFGLRSVERAAGFVVQAVAD